MGAMSGFLYATMAGAVPLWAILTIVGTALAALLLVLYFVLFSHQRVKKQVGEIVRRYEYPHALLFGQDAQYIRQLEDLSQHNLLYATRVEELDRRYRAIRMNDDAEMTRLVNELKDLIADKKYGDAKKKIPGIRAKLDQFSDKALALDNDLKAERKPEETCRQKKLELAQKLSEVKQTYYTQQNALSLVSTTFEVCFAKILDGFNEFEKEVNDGHYEEATDILTPLGKVIGELQNKALPVLPGMCATIQSVIPDKISSLQNRYEEMVRAGYPLGHLMTNASIDDMEAQLKDLTTRVKRLDLNGVQVELDSIRSRIDDLFTAFDKEKAAREQFEEKYESVYTAERETQNVFIRANHQLPEVRAVYVIGPAEEAKINETGNLVNLAEASKRTLDLMIHSLPPRPYTVLLTQMEDLEKKSKDADAAIQDFKAYVSSLKSDTEGAMGEIKTYAEKLRQLESDVRLCGIEPFVERYKDAFDSCFQDIDATYSAIIENKPIDVAKVNECAAKLKGEADLLIKQASKDIADLRRAEKDIMIANRSRGHFADVSGACQQAEAMFASADFARAAILVENALESRRRMEQGE